MAGVSTETMQRHNCSIHSRVTCISQLLLLLLLLLLPSKAAAGLPGCRFCHC
jgi:hypothetical protein